MESWFQHFLIWSHFATLSILIAQFKKGHCVNLFFIHRDNSIFYHNESIFLVIQALNLHFQERYRQNQSELLVLIQ